MREGESGETGKSRGPSARGTLGTQDFSRVPPLNLPSESLSTTAETDHAETTIQSSTNIPSLSGVGITIVNSWT